MKMKRVFPVVIVVMVMVWGLATPGFAALSGDRVAELKVAIHSDENTLTPYTYVTGYPGLAVMQLVFDSLFILDAENRPLPWMVREYRVTDDFSGYEMSLYAGQFWHDGRPVTAEDIAFTFTYPLGQNQGRWRRIAAQVEEVVVHDELNFFIKLKEGNPDFIAQALTDLPVIPRHIYEGVADATTVAGAVGSGPYRLSEYKPGQHYVFDAVSGYFRGDALAGRLVMPIITDNTATFQALRAGSIHAATAHLAPELVSGFGADKDINVVTGPGLATTLLQINCEVYPFTLAEMRKALVLALDLRELVEVVMLGFGDAGSLGFYHPQSLFGRSDLIPVRDLVKSNQILDGLGFARQGDTRTDGEGRPLSFELLVQAGNPLRVRAAELIARQLKEVGIQIKVVSLERATLDDLVWPGFDVAKGRNYTLSMWGWSAPVQLRTDALIQLFSSDHLRGTLNIGGFASPAFGRLEERFMSDKSPEGRAGVINEMQDLLALEMPIIPLYYPQVIMAYRPEAYPWWVMQQGQGTISKISFLPEFLTEAAPAPNQGDEPAAGAGSMIYLIPIAFLALFIVFKKRKRVNAG